MVDIRNFHGTVIGIDALRRLKRAVAISQVKGCRIITSDEQIRFAILVDVASRTVNDTVCPED